jgi:hypothetical protein
LRDDLPLSVWSFSNRRTTSSRLARNGFCSITWAPLAPIACCFCRYSQRLC